MMKNIQTTYRIEVFQDDQWQALRRFQSSSLEEVRRSMQLLAKEHAVSAFRIVKHERIEIEDVVDWTWTFSSKSSL